MGEICRIGDRGDLPLQAFEGTSTMKKRLLAGIVVSAGMLVGSVGMAGAGSSNHTEPGTPGAKNCVGQSMAYLAQLDGEAHGIGNLAATEGLSVKEVRTIVQEYCNS